MTLRYSDVTPQHLYLNRRRWFASLLAAKMALAGKLPPFTRSSFSTDEKPTPLKDVTSYNNFYEFGTQKEQPAVLARNFKTSPWTVVVDGLAGKPKKFDLDEILKLAPLEERIYRHRCVEAWSMVVPWIGFPLNALLKQVDPKPGAKFVAFESYYDPRQMPAAGGAGINFPYVEGLRMDEAMHPLTILCTGLYGDVLPNQNGAPLRLVVPWKYGFKGIKSIVRIRLVGKLPDTTWNLSNAHEYGFYSNVNPEVDHPRWTQAKERRIGELLRRTTVKFNGYGDQVASMYAGMDLSKYY